MAKPPRDLFSSTLTDDGSLERPDLTVKMWLTVVHGNDRGKRFGLTGSTITIGRSHEADIVLDDKMVSRVHCKVTISSLGLVRVVDNNSHNGLFVDEKRVERSMLSPESNLRIGGTVLRVEHKAPEEVQAEEELFAAATTDALTGAPNRTSFLARARGEVAHTNRHGVPIAVAFVDLDHFKNVNDTFGHAAGDAVLRDIAGRLRDATREEDLWCRYGGEEFVILLREAPLADAVRFCERIREGIAGAPSSFEDKKIPVTTSIGVTEFRDGDSLEDLLRRADLALYRAKDQGRNRVVSDP